MAHAIQAPALPAWMTLRRCRRCGFGGQAAQSDVTLPLHCPACGDNWYASAPASYAELEGFAPAVPGVPMQLFAAEHPAARRTLGWWCFWLAAILASVGVLCIGVSLLAVLGVV